MNRQAIVALMALGLACGGATGASAHSAPKAAETANIQGDQQSWINDPHIRQFYELSAASLRPATAAADVPGYEAKSFAIFRDFAVSRGMSPDAMQDHLKLIPRQVVQIVKEDPKVLDSYQNFVEAVFGPQ